jgi:hypothetical protein
MTRLTIPGDLVNPHDPRLRIPMARVVAGWETVVRRGLADVLAWLGEDIVPGHECDKPFWATKDETWVCPICLQRWRWTITTGTVPGVPAAVCTVLHKEWVQT